MKSLGLYSTLGAVLLHVLLGLLLWIYAKPHKLPEPPPVMQAVLMSAAPPGAPAPTPAAPAQPAPAPVVEPKPAPELPKPELPKPQPEKPKQEKPAPEKPAPAKPALPPKPTATPVEPKKPVKPKLDDKRFDDEVADIEAETQQKAREQAEKRKRDADARQKALADAMKNDADALAEAAAADARARLLAAQIGEFSQAIHKKIKSQWHRPAGVTGKLTASVRITVLPGGEVASVLVTRSSGNPAFDASVKEAVERASPLPVPSDAMLFRENFRIFALNYNTEE